MPIVGSELGAGREVRPRLHHGPPLGDQVSSPALGQATVPERIAYAREPSKLPVVLSADGVRRHPLVRRALPTLRQSTPSRFLCGTSPCEARMGAIHFLMKMLPRVASEMALHVLAYNLTRVMNIMGIRPLMAAMRA